MIALERYNVVATPRGFGIFDREAQKLMDVVFTSRLKAGSVVEKIQQESTAPVSELELDYLSGIIGGEA